MPTGLVASRGHGPRDNRPSRRQGPSLAAAACVIVSQALRPVSRWSPAAHPDSPQLVLAAGFPAAGCRAPRLGNRVPFAALRVRRRSYSLRLVSRDRERPARRMGGARGRRPLRNRRASAPVRSSLARSRDPNTRCGGPRSHRFVAMVASGSRPRSPSSRPSGGPTTPRSDRRPRPRTRRRRCAPGLGRPPASQGSRAPRPPLDVEAADDASDRRAARSPHPERLRVEPPSLTIFEPDRGAQLHDVAAQRVVAGPFRTCGSSGRRGRRRSR